MNLRPLRAATLAVALSLLVAASALAAEPTPTPIGGDPRSPGEGPGFVGEPLLAIGAVIGIALVAVVATTAWVRLTARRHGDDSTGGPARR